MSASTTAARRWRIASSISRMRPRARSAPSATACSPCASRWSSRHLTMRMTLRSHLIMLVLVAVLPLLLFSAIVVGLAADSERDATERGLRATAHAVGTAVDHALDNAVGALRVLATSDLLDAGNLQTFHGVAVRALDAQRGWLSVAVVDQ